jgi:hypothetical protein
MTAMMMRTTTSPQHIHLRVFFWYFLACTSSLTPDSTWSLAFPTCQQSSKNVACPLNAMGTELNRVLRHRTSIAFIALVIALV